MNAIVLTAIEPERWVLVFQRSSKVWWVRWLAWGKYKHVAAYAYLPGLRMWQIYSVNMERASLIVVPDGDEARGWLYDLTCDADLLAFKRSSGRTRVPIFGWCVPAIKHLIGLRSLALRPDAMYRAAIRAGARPPEPSGALSE